jgi:YidC/Oxa1 family membrane protein insertase
MDRTKLNNVIGFGLIFLILIVWMQLNKPSKELVAKQKMVQDSIANAAKAKETVASIPASSDATKLPDSLVTKKLQSGFGGFATAASGTNQTFDIENEFMKVTFSTKGGRISKVLLKKYTKLAFDSITKKDVKRPLYLMEDEKNQFSYSLPIRGTDNGVVKTGDLFFQPTVNGKTISFRAMAGDGQYFEQIYTLADKSYNIKYQVNTVGLGSIWSPDKTVFELNWNTYLDKVEKNSGYERNYSTVYYKKLDENPNYCSCQKTAKDDLEKAVKWVSQSNQFFNSSLIAETAFKNGVVATEVLPVGDPDLKKINTLLRFDNPNANSQSYKMDFYIGPNKLENLKAYNVNLEDIISFGASILGTVNRWVMHPIFMFLMSLFGSAGFAILGMTLLVKLILSPLTFKMMHSQAKMASLKPYITKIKEKHPNDTQAQQVETMQIYREFGVNPLGGCLPMVLQMPIWFALYRFFPASIEFRQQSFLWASDLSSYDSIYNIGYSIPFYGDHISLFSILWMVSTLAYSYYTMKDNEMMGQNAQMMKVMQYAMPIVFFVFFNNFASGLSCYLVFSNLLNITQNLGIKAYFIDHDKIKVNLENFRAKPKKKSGFQDRLEQAMKEQQRVKNEKQNKNKK